MTLHHAHNGYLTVAARLAVQAGGCAMSEDQTGIVLRPVIAVTLVPVRVARDGTIRLGSRPCSERQMIALMAGLKRVEQHHTSGGRV
ncbi:hypothetical protein [Komagataeibacter europaeus]|uniref:hypothetical protein n=1 Tax=Komagataeibacter europaeus TaxID=33995 RepID=UPI00030DD212|nr:hypothetical protein [Komagataeibacter europaeus]GBQ46940.1 hypothetical protein AA18890_2687 [Komagataeibacter europaeus LMG 18890]